MKNLLKSIVLMIITLLVIFTACGGSGDSDNSDSGEDGTPAGTFTKEVAVADSGENNYPFSNSRDTKTQYLYTAEEIGGSGKITGIRLMQRAETTTAVTCPNTTIKMGHTSLSVLTTTWSGSTGNVRQGKGSEQVVLNNASVTIPAAAAGSWIDIALATPFYYNGVDNLVVDFERATASSDTVPTVFAIISDRRAYGSAVDTIAGTPEFNATTATAVDGSLPWMQFVFEGGDNKVDFNTSPNGMIAPFTTNVNLTKLQNLYAADAIAGSGLITGIALQVNTVTTEQTYKYTIKLAHTTKTALETTWADNFTAGSVTVANALEFRIPAGIPAGEFIWLPIPDGAFTYNGTDNLLVEITTTDQSGNNQLTSHPTMNANCAYGNPGSPTATAVQSYAYQIVLRFYGGKSFVLPGGTNLSPQVLGSGSPVAVAGQLQSLYENYLLGSGGTITNVYVRLIPDSTPSASNLTNYKLYMGHTSKTSYVSGQAYSANMDENKLVFSGTLAVPAGLSPGDWVKIPLNSPFVYNPRKNLSILFTTDAGAAGNLVSCKWDDTRFLTRMVGRNDNSGTGIPAWIWDGIIEIALDVVE